MLLPLNNNDREALIIRWGTILRSVLLDYFNVTYDYNRMAVKEILDLEQAVIKSSCLGNSIEVPERGFPNRLVDEICTVIGEVDARQLRELLREMEGLRNTFRNPETHTLSLPMPPKETVKRCMKKFKDLIEIIDPEFKDYVRTEAEGFSRLMYFYYEVALRETTSYRDDTDNKLLLQLKSRSDEVEIRTDRGRIQRGTLTSEERNPHAVVKLIESGYLDTIEFQSFMKSAISGE